MSRESQKAFPDSLTRRGLLKAGTALGGFAMLQGFASGLALVSPRTARAATRFITVRSTSKSWLWAPEDFARDSGDYSRFGLDLESTSTGRGVNVSALVGGATDVVLGAPGPTIHAQVQGQPVKMIAGLVNKYASHIVINKGILDRAGVNEGSPLDKKIAVLKGLRLGTTGPGAAPDTLFRFMMAKGGINPDKEAQLVTIQGGGSGMLAGMQKGVIDGFCLSSPTSDLAVQKFGAAYLFNMASNPPPELANYLYIVATVSNKALTEKREALVNYCRGLTVALQAINAKPAAFKGWAKQWFQGLDPAIFETAFEVNSRIYMPNPVPTQQQFDLNLLLVNQELKTLGKDPVPGSFGFRDAYDPTIAEEAVKSI
jgi:NitT/TauT family transport system substrate-binding protein